MSPAIELTGFRGTPVWELLTAHYLLMIQAGAWALLIGCLPRALGFKHPGSLRIWGVLAGTGLALAAPLNLVAELLSPERFATMLYRVHPTSPLSWGVGAILALTAFGLAECLVLLRGDKAASPWSSRLACLAALGVIAYTWIEVNRAVGIPLWSGSFPSVTLAASGMAAGLAVCLGLGHMAPGQTVGRLPKLLAALACAVSGLALYSWGTLSPWPELPGWPTGTALLAGGSAALLLAAGLYLRKPGKSLVWACLLALGGAWSARMGILMAGQSAALGRNLGEPHLTGHEGILTALAPMALWVFLMFVASMMISRMPGLSAREGGQA
jgi:formate-dependent nitrite reductase membrane component NrfD